MLETFQHSYNALFSHAECKSPAHVIINLSFDDLRNCVYPVICQSATRLSDRQGANVGPCETPGLPDTQPEAAHLNHEYRDRGCMSY